eukprot:1108215_1
MSQKQNVDEWLEDGKALLSSLMNHGHAQPLLDSFYENNDNSGSINKKIDFKQIEQNLLNNDYESIDALFDDITLLFDNALKLFNNSQNIIPIQQLFVEYKNSYSNRNQSDVTPNQPSPTNSNSNSPSQRSKTRRRSARLAKQKNTDRDSDDNDIDIYIGINVSNADRRNKKRPFSAIMTDDQTIHATNKIARTNTGHTSPRMAVDITTNAQLDGKKRNRRRRKKNMKESIDIDINNNEQKHDVEDEEDCDVDMVQPPPSQRVANIKYNLRSLSKQKHKLKKPLSNTAPLTPSKSKTPIAPKMMKPLLQSSKAMVDREVVKESSVDESVINFEDGTSDSLCGKFETATNMMYSCKAVCINGDFKPFNQDWISLDRFDQFKNEDAVIFCGVYDGHGILGHNASKYCARHLPKRFMFELYDIKRNQSQYIQSMSTATASIPNEQEEENNTAQEEHRMVQALRRALFGIDSDLKEISRNESTMFSTILQRQGCESRLIDYGTTVNGLVCDGCDAFVINVGDSRCILIEGYCDESNDQKWTLDYKQITEDHNPFTRGDEVERVASANGQFFKQGEELRLYPKDKTFKEARRKGLAINMTRAVGHSTLCQYGLTAQPECYHVKMEQDHEYIFVMASDGIWDILSNQDVFQSVQSIYTSFIHNQTKQTIEEEIAMELLENAEKKWRKRRVGDNISVVVTRIVKNE